MPPSWVCGRCGARLNAGSVVDASLIPAPRQRNTKAERAGIKAGKTAAEIWPDKLARAAQKDADARWTVKFTKARPKPDGSAPIVAFPIPTFGWTPLTRISHAVF